MRLHLPFALLVLAAAFSLSTQAQTTPATVPASTIPAVLLRALSQSESSPPTTNPVPPTPETLEKWLVDKDVVALQFTGPHTDLHTLESAFQLPKSDVHSFWIGISENAGADRSSVRLKFQVNPETIRRALALQLSLATRGFRLDPAGVTIASYRGDAANRAKARRLLPDILASMRENLPKVVPGIQCTPFPATNSDSWGFDYSLAGSEIRGAIVVSTITVERLNSSRMIATQSLNLRALGLTIDNRSNQFGGGGVSTQEEAIRKAFFDAFASLVELDQTSLPGTLPAPKSGQ